MRKRLRRARCDGTLTPADWRRRSRAALERRVIGAVFVGDGLTTIARRPHMPRAATVKRWIARDAAFRERHEHACDYSRYILADDMRMLAKQAWTNARTARQRTAAVRMQLDLIKWRAKTFRKAPQADDENNRLIRERFAAFDMPPNEARASAGAATLAKAEAASPDSRSRTPASRNSADPPSPVRPSIAPPIAPEPEPHFDRLGFPIHRDPPGAWTVRFDVDAPRPDGMSTYDPMKW